jgi:hypothetical protein
MKITIGEVLLAGTVFAFAFGTSIATHAESEECDELPQARQAMCWMVLSCTAIEEPAKRQECFRAAYEGFREATGRQGGAVALEPAAPKQPVAVQADPPTAANTPHEVAAEPAIASSTVASSTAPEVAAATKPASPIYEVETTTKVVKIADEFNATVTYQRTLLRDRQVFVVDNSLVFEGDEARVSRLKVGEVVSVERNSRLFKDRFSVTGPSKRPVAAKRLRCENNNQTAETAEKCELRKR